MEYVVVQYPEERDVHMDGQIAGRTNKTLMVEQGHHVFDLGKPDDYEPASQEVAVQNTTALSPHIVPFSHKGTTA